MDKSEKAVKIFDVNAKLYATKYMDLTSYARSLSFFAEQLKKKDANLLDIACGPGNITQYLLNKNSSLKILGIDLSPQMLGIAQANNPLARFQNMDIRQINLLSEKYDGIICGFGLPYLSKEEALQLITDAAELLNPGGILYLSTMEDDYEKSSLQVSSSGEHELFMHFHEGAYLKTEMEKKGFKILFEERLEIEESEAMDLVLIGGKE